MKITIEDKFTVIRDFACLHHAPEQPDRMKDLFEWVKEREYSKPIEWEKHKDFLTTRILYDLTQFNVWITEVPLDPGGWGALEAGTGEEVKNPSKYYIQFDRFEDGLYLLLKRVVEFYENKPQYESEEDEDE